MSAYATATTWRRVEVEVSIEPRTGPHGEEWRSKCPLNLDRTTWRRVEVEVSIEPRTGPHGEEWRSKCPLNLGQDHMEKSGGRSVH